MFDCSLQFRFHLLLIFDFIFNVPSQTLTPAVQPVLWTGVQPAKLPERICSPKHPSHRSSIVPFSLIREELGLARAHPHRRRTVAEALGGFLPHEPMPRSRPLLFARERRITRVSLHASSSRVPHSSIPIKEFLKIFFFIFRSRPVLKFMRTRILGFTGLEHWSSLLYIPCWTV